MSTRTGTWLAWSTWFFSALFAATALVIIFLGVSDGGSFLEFGSVINEAAIAAAFSTVGAVVASRRSTNPIGWIMCAGGLGVAMGSLTDAYAIYALVTTLEEPLPGAAFSAWVSLWITTAGMNSFLLLLLLFPNGKLPSMRWWPVVWLVVFTAVAESTVSAFLDERFIGYRDISNPFHISVLDPIGEPYVTYAQMPLSIVAVLLPTTALVTRFRYSRGEERQQLKWFVTSGVVVALVGVFISVVLALLGEESFRSQVLLSILFPLLTFALCGIPISIGVAIFRYRLYELDLLINRTLVYGSLTVVLAGVYEGTIVMFQEAFRELTGQESSLAIVASTLAIAALFHPLRRRMQAFVDRRFYRTKYDAVKTLEAFSAKLRQETDLGALSADLVSVAKETMQPAHVSLWLRSDTSAKDEK